MKALKSIIKVIGILVISTNAYSHTVELVISTTKLSATNTTNGKVFSAFSSKVIDGQSEFSLDEIGKKVSPDADKLIIKIQKENGSTEEYKIPEQTLSGVLKYLIETPTSTSCTKIFDCACFAHYVNGVGMEKVMGENSLIMYKLRDVWDMSNFSEKEIKPGDVVRLYSKGHRSEHYAIYLGGGLYISKFGTTGPLIITDLESIKIGFDTPEAQLWRLME